MKLRINNCVFEIVEFKSAFKKAMGLRFRKKIKKNNAYLFHLNPHLTEFVDMFFVYNMLDLILIDKNMKITKTYLLKPNTIIKIPKGNVYAIELVHRKHNFKSGDNVSFIM